MMKRFFEEKMKEIQELKKIVKLETCSNESGIYYVFIDEVGNECVIPDVIHHENYSGNGRYHKEYLQHRVLFTVAMSKALQGEQVLFPYNVGDGDFETMNMCGNISELDWNDDYSLTFPVKHFNPDEHEWDEEGNMIS